VEVKEEKVTS